MSKENKQQPVELLAFEKARFDFCLKIYEQEEERREYLEKKAQFYFSMTTLILGAIFLNLEFLNKLQGVLASGKISSSILNSIYFTMIILATTLLTSLVVLLDSIRLQTYKGHYPSNINYQLFAPDSKFVINKNEITFLETIGMSYALALEQNKIVNEKKAGRLKAASYSILVAVISLTAFLVLITYSFMH